MYTKKKLAANAFVMAQSGQYNYSRCMMHSEAGAARLAISEFTEHTIKLIYLLNKRYCPYYKWMFRGLRELDILSELHAPLLSLVSGFPVNTDSSREIIEQISQTIAHELRKHGYCNSHSDYLADLAFEIQDSIHDYGIRSLHISQG